MWFKWVYGKVGIFGDQTGQLGESGEYWMGRWRVVWIINSKLQGGRSRLCRLMPSSVEPRWASGMRNTTGKTWTVQVSWLKAGVKPSYRKAGPMRKMINTKRTWAISKASRHKAVLSWFKTIWAMVRSMRELRQITWVSAKQSTRIRLRRNTRIRMRQKINELITVWVSSIIKMSLLNSLTSEVKLN
jgi:hypothetical protein